MRHTFVDITAFVASTTSVIDVVGLMGNSQPRLSCVFIADGENLVGSFAESALLPLLAQGRSLADLTMAEVMQTPVISVRQSDLSDLSIPVQLLQQHATDCLAVLDEQGALAGVITRGSLQPHLWEVLQAQQAQLTHQQEVSTTLSQSAAQYQALLQALPDLVVRTSAEGVYLDRVDSADFKFYCGDAALVGKRGDEVLPAELAARRLEYIRQALQTRELQIYDQQIVINGSLRTEEVRINVCGDNQVLVIVRDITDRKTLEDTNRAILEAIPDLLVRINWQGQYLGILSGGSVKKVLLPPSDVSHGTVYDVLPHHLAEQKAQAAQRALETGTILLYEQQIEINGELCWEEVRVSPINGNEALLMIRDISERKQAEIALYELNQELEARVDERTAALRASEERWHLAVEGSALSIWDWNMTTGQVFRTNRWYELRGLPENEVSSAPEAWSDQIHPDDRDRVLTTMADHLAHKTAFYQQEYRIQCKDGAYIWILDRGLAIWDEAGNPTRFIGSEMDITPRKQAELEAQTLKRQLEFVISSSPAAIFTCQLDGATTFMSDNIVNLTGYTSAEFLSRPDFWTIHLHPQDAPRLLAELPALFDQGQHIHEYRFLHKAGHYVWVRNELRLMRDAQGTPVEIVGYFADIGDRKAIENQLRKSQAALSEAQRMVHLGSWEVDVATNQISWSDELFHVFGLDPSEPEPNYAEHFNLIHPEDLDRLEQCLDRARREGTPYAIELRILRVDGSIGYLDARGAAKRDDQGQIAKILGTALDITERKVAELERQNLSNRLALALSSGAIGCWDWDIQQNTILWDERMYELYGASAVDVDSDLPYEIWANGVHPDDRQAIETLLQQAALGQAVYDPEFRVVHPDGSIHHIKAYGMVVVDPEGNPKSMIGLNLDISERKRSEAERKQAEKRLQQINERLRLTNAELDRATRLKDEFLANMSHELRTPLNAILGMSEGLKEHVFGSLTDRQRQAVETIERSGTHLLELINDILDLSKIEAGKLELETALVNVQYLCESSLTFVRQMAFSKGIRLSLESVQVMSDIEVDERRIRQILINLLSNAIKFTPTDGQVTLRAGVEQQNGVDHLKLSVIDTGIGIAPGDIAKLFQPFVQIDSSLSRQYNGTGLGLALVRKIAELHGGTVSVTSEVNQGSCFTLDLPYLTERALPAIATPTPPSSLLDIHNSRVLVIEDSATAAGQIARYLEEQGMESIIRSSGDQVMSDVITFQPALILLDILLPNLSGWDVLQQLKTAPETRAIPVIVVSVVDERSYGLSLGASEYLVKPISRHQLQQAIERLSHNPQAPLSRPPVVPLPDSSQPAIETPLILLAEDNDMNVATVSSYLTALGYRLIYAKNGQTAVELAQTQMLDLILMDIQMPDMDGLEAMQLIRSDARCANIPIVALTALAMPGDRERCLAAGANHYLSKPFKMKALKGLIQQLLQSA